MMDSKLRLQLAGHMLARTVLEVLERGTHPSRTEAGRGLKILTNGVRHVLLTIILIITKTKATQKKKYAGNGLSAFCDKHVDRLCILPYCDWTDRRISTSSFGFDA